jgi:putative DNA primase/helicase
MRDAPSAQKVAIEEFVNAMPTANICADETGIRARISKLDTVTYDQKRKELAKEYGIRPVTLDGLRKDTAQKAESLQGREIAPDDPEPWPDKVDGAALLDEIEKQLCGFVVLPESSIVPVVLWAALTYITDDLQVLPNLVFSSPVKRSGKTTALEVVSRLVRKPMASSTITCAALFRVVEKCQPTLLIDEADRIFKENEDLRTLVNSGFTRTAAYAIRCVGDDQEPRQFSTWCAKAIALIGKLPPTIVDRSIIVHMRRKGTGEAVERLRAGADMGFGELRCKLARFARDTVDIRITDDPFVPAELNDRAADCWRELLKVAEAAGGAWPKRAREAALQGEDGDEEDVKVLLLADIRDFFDDHPGSTRITGKEIVDYLVGIEGRPWNEWGKREIPMTPTGLAHALSDFGIKTKNAKVNGKTPLKTYNPKDFEDVFSRYLPNKRYPLPAAEKTLRDNDLQGSGGVAVADTKCNPNLSKSMESESSSGCETLPLLYPLPINTIQDNKISIDGSGLRKNPGAVEDIQPELIDTAPLPVRATVPVYVEEIF